VWASAQHKPLVVGRRFFRSQVTDIAWSPDGSALLAASSDGALEAWSSL
jgi:WD40 repeat protein